MEYKKDKRTENLTMRDIHVGDWVQVWSEQTERYSPPLKIIQICDDGTIYLITSDEERCTPWEEDIKNVDALPITKELLKGFGFDVVPKDYPNDEYDIIYNGEKICELWMLSNSCTLETLWQSYESFHEFIDGMCDEFPEILNLEWKGVECKEANEVITDFESAKKLLSKSIGPIKDAEILIKELNPKHIEALVALNRLFTIAEDWNKEDGFVPDFSNGNQCKYFPWFIYNNDAAGFVCAYTHYSPVYASAYLGSRLCFKTSERAAQFGKQFIHLYNKVFL